MNSSYLACMPWYDNDSSSHNLDQLWYVMAEFLRAGGVDNVPSDLVRDQDIKTLWRSSHLLLAQCCGPDLFTLEGGELYVIARPVFANLDCTPGCYYSHIVSRTRRPCRTARVAVNSPSSRSGYLALFEWMRGNGIEASSVQVSGSHKNSLTMLDENLADLAAIDAHTLNQQELSLNFPIIGQSSEAPAPPFVFHRDIELDSNLLFDALEYAVDKKGRAVGILGLERCQRSYYKRYSTDSNTEN